MAKLDYFRRPVLIGNTARRTQNATIRGSVRRNDADGISATPYVPGITGKTLQIKIEGTTYVAGVFASDDYAAAIATINAAIGGHGAGVANGEAFDTDGVITIRSTSVSGLGAPLGATGSVEIVGGTAATALGFDLTFHPLKAYGGEFASAPEGRVGNPFRTAFPTHSENLSTDSVNRAMSLLSTNMDMLFADNNREDAMLTKVPVTNNGTYLTVPAGVSVPIGLGSLSRNSRKEDLAPFFQIVDVTTKQPHASRVVAVVKGAPAAAYPTGWPYADQALWSDNLGRNLLGLAIDKMAAGVAISAITEGRYVTCPGASFLSTAAAEDFVSISSATNTNVSDNNGLKWVVESVISNTVLALRPMSQGELFLVGMTPTSVQPQMDLAGDLGIGQAFGNLIVKTGAFATVPASQPDSLNLVVYPALLPGAPIELWMASPMCWMDSGPYDMQSSSGQILKTLASDLDPTVNGLLSAPTLGTIGGTSFSVGSFYARWHGRAIRVGAQDVNVPADPYALSVVYWEEASNSLKAYTLSTAIGVFNPTTIFNGLAAAEPSNSAGDVFGFPVALVSSAGGFVTSATSVSKIIGSSNSCTLTVGHGGQFQTLQEAANFLLLMSKVNAETTAATGAFEHVEIVLLSSQTLTAQVSFSQPDIVIRGASPAVEVTVNFGAFDYVLQNTLGGIRLQDVVVNSPGSPCTLVSHFGTFGKCELRNVRRGTGLPLAAAAYSSDIGVDVVIDSCNLNLCGQVASGPGARNIYITRSVLNYVANAYTTTPQVISVVSYDRLFIDKSSFSSWKNNSAGVLFDGTSATFIAVRDSNFLFGAQSVAATSWFCSASNARTVFSNCSINMTGAYGINLGTGLNTVFDGCSIVCSAYGAQCIMVSEFTNNIVLLSADDATHSNNVVVGSGVTDGALISGNRFSGSQPSYWVNVPALSKVSDNSFAPTASAWFPTSTALIQTGANSTISGNTCTSTVGMTGGVVANGAGVEVTGNYFDLSTATGAGLYLIGAHCVVSGNYFKANKPLNTGGSSDYLCSNNQFLGTATTDTIFNSGTFSSNYFTGPVHLVTSPAVITFNDCVFEHAVNIDGVGYVHVSNCTFKATGNIITGPQVSNGEPPNRKALVSGSTFYGITTLTDCLVDGCAFDMGGLSAIGAGSLFLSGCEVMGSNFIATSPDRDIVRMQNSTLIGCKSSCMIMDHVSLKSAYNSVFDTYCFALIAGPTTYQGMFFSDRTYKLVVSGCDTATVNGDFSTLYGPRDVSISSTRTDQIWMNGLAQANVVDCKVGLRNTMTPNTLSSRLDLQFYPWDNANATLTGTSAFTNGSTTVTGTGTKYKTEVQVGDLIRVSTHADSVLGKVSTIGSDTSITLAANYAGATETGATVSGGARGTFIGNDIDAPTGTISCAAVAAPDAWFSFAGNRITGRLDVGFTIANAGAYVSSLVMTGNHLFRGTGPNLTVKSYSSTTMNISGNYFDGGVSVTYDSGGGAAPAWGSPLFSGVFTNNTSRGAVDIRHTRGLVITGNNIACSPSNELLTLYRVLDVVIDSNYIFKTVSNGFNKLIQFNDVKRARLTNNVLGSDWVAPDGTELLLFLGNAATSPYDLVIMGNHMYFFGAGSSAPTQATLAAGYNIYYLLDAATGTTNPVRLGGTTSAPTALP